MYAFAVFVFFAFAVMGLTMLASQHLEHTREHWMLAAGVIGVALAWLTGFDVWKVFHVHVREAWVGVTLTGVALGAGAMFLHAVTSFFAGLHRKLDDQAEAMEKHELRQAA